MLGLFARGALGGGHQRKHVALQLAAGGAGRPRGPRHRGEPAKQGTGTYPKSGGLRPTTDIPAAAVRSLVTSIE